jgi:hypothetical protein
MTVRIQMKLGVVADAQRLPDSPDTVLVVEPSVGSTARTKGNLYLLVTASGGRRLRDATRMVAERIRDEYYYDESAGISVCLQKAIRSANKRLLHSNDRLITRQGEPGPIGLAVAVVRGNELYVATLGPAEAYLVRQARLLTLPDQNPDSGLPAQDVADTEVWHGEILVGDCLVLVTPNVTRRLGLTPIQDALVQLHPQSAIEQIHRQLTGGGIGVTGGDGMIAIEAGEVGATVKTQPLKPVWPSDPLAGIPDRSPIPLADQVSDGVAAVQSGARHASQTADGMMRGAVYGLLDKMPRRPTPRSKIKSATLQRERQQRLAAAVLGGLVILVLVVASAWAFAGHNAGDAIDTHQKAQQAYAQIGQDLDSVFGNGRDLLKSDPNRAVGYLSDAYTQLQLARANGYPEADLAAYNTRVVAGLNRYYEVTDLAPQVLASFGSDDLEDVVLGPDGAAYVLDKTANTVYRVDLATGAKTTAAFKGEQDAARSGTVGTPRLLAVGGQDVLILDSNNAIWRWRNESSTLVQLSVPDASTWGTDVRAFGTFTPDAQHAELGQYNLYVVVPSVQEILKYTESSDSSVYPASSRSPWLSVEQDVSSVDDMFIDGSIYLIQKGVLSRFDNQTPTRGWSPKSPGDTILRPGNSSYTHLAADNPVLDQGNLYAYDGVHRRIVVFAKVDGSFQGQYMVQSSSQRLTALKSLFVLPSPTGASRIYWVESGDLMTAPISTAASTPSSAPSGSGSAKPSGSASASGSSKASAKPSGTK